MDCPVDYPVDSSLPHLNTATLTHPTCITHPTPHTHPALFSYSPSPDMLSECPSPSPWKVREGIAMLRAGDMGATELKGAKQESGIKKLYFPLDPEYLPLVDPTTTSTQDILHLFPDGLTRSEFAWLMYILLKLKLSLARVNAAIRRYPGWPPDVRIPPLQAKLSQGTSGGKPRSAALPSMTGSQMMHFALHR